MAAAPGEPIIPVLCGVAKSDDGAGAWAAIIVPNITAATSARGRSGGLILGIGEASFSYPRPTDSARQPPERMKPVTANAVGVSPLSTISQHSPSDGLWRSAPTLNRFSRCCS